RSRACSTGWAQLELQHRLGAEGAAAQAGGRRSCQAGRLRQKELQQAGARSCAGWGQKELQQSWGQKELQHRLGQKELQRRLGAEGAAAEAGGRRSCSTGWGQKGELQHRLGQKELQQQGWGQKGWQHRLGKQDRAAGWSRGSCGLQHRLEQRRLQAGADGAAGLLQSRLQLAHLKRRRTAGRAVGAAGGVGGQLRVPPARQPVSRRLPVLPSTTALPAAAPFVALLDPVTGEQRLEVSRPASCATWTCRPARAWCQRVVGARRPDCDNGEEAEAGGAAAPCRGGPPGWGLVDGQDHRLWLGDPDEPQRCRLPHPLPGRPAQLAGLASQQPAAAVPAAAMASLAELGLCPTDTVYVQANRLPVAAVAMSSGFVRMTMVLVESLAGTGHTRLAFRPRNSPTKKELLAFDPLVQQEVLYREPRAAAPRRRMLKWLEKQRSVWRARHRCQTRARPHTVCLLCCRVIRAWGAITSATSTACWPTSGAATPVSGSRCPTCGRIFRELCFHKIRAGRPCGHARWTSWTASRLALPLLLPPPASGGCCAAPFEYDSDDGGGGASGGASESGGTGRQLPAAATVADRDASTGGELRLATYMLDIGSDCAICCDRIESDVGVPDACCHQYCFACLLVPPPAPSTAGRSATYTSGRGPAPRSPAGWALATAPIRSTCRTFQSSSPPPSPVLQVLMRPPLQRQETRLATARASASASSSASSGSASPSQQRLLLEADGSKSANMHSHCRLLSLLLLLCLLPPAALSEEQQDLYSVLGVSRSATPQEVKQAYKRLARANHPDKSKDPGASDRFVRINEAYEILSDASKRREYDMFGTVQADPRHPSFHSFHASPSPSSFTSTSSTLTRPAAPRWSRSPCASISRLLLSCMRVGPLWRRLAEDLLPLGVPMAVVHAGMSSNLAEILRIDQVPAIIGVVDGVAYHYSGQLSLAGLRDFYRSLFPVDTLPPLADSGAAAFLSGWSDNRPRAVLAKPLGRPPIRFLMAAYAWRSRLAFAYADTASSSVEAFRSARRLSGGLESVLLFDEDGEVGRLESARLETEALSAWLEARKHLALPRLASPELAEELCPAQMAYRDKFLCVLLLLRPGEENRTGCGLL
uniref:J domain-containing protein n=1 Tax=Macrostomum lignano TaxID=282301 RepID=A0A1I8FCZ0_9PLAT